jgi:cytidylate kinase
MAVLTISRQFGAGGWSLGKSVADHLNYQFVSGEVINKIAEEANVSPEWIRSTEKNAGDWLIRFTSSLVSSSFIERHIGESRADFDEGRYIAFLKKIIVKIAEEDNVVFLGRGSQFILQDKSNALHVLVVADLEDRINFLERIWHVSRKDAEKAIQTREKRRDTFLKQLGQWQPNSLRLYHVIVNTSKMEMDRAEQLLLWLVKDFEGRVKQKSS